MRILLGSALPAMGWRVRFGMSTDPERSRSELAKRTAHWIEAGEPLRAELEEIGKDAFRARYMSARYNQAFSAHVAQVRQILDELDRQDEVEVQGRTLSWTKAGAVAAALAAVFALIAVLQQFGAFD